MATGHAQCLALGQTRNETGVMTHDHTTRVPAHHRQRHLQLSGATGAGVGHAAIDADFGRRIEAQTQLVADLVQTVLQVGIEAFRIETAKQCFTSKVAARTVEIGEFFTPAEGAAGRGQSVDEAKTLGGTDHPLIGAGQHRRIKHHHAAIQLRATQSCMQVQHAAERMTDAPHRLILLLQMVDQLVDEVVPVVICRETRVMGMLLQMRNPILGRQRREQFAIGARGEPVGVGEKDWLRHTGKSMSGKRALIVRKTESGSNDRNCQE